MTNETAAKILETTAELARSKKRNVNFNEATAQAAEMGAASLRAMDQIDSDVARLSGLKVVYSLAVPRGTIYVNADDVIGREFPAPPQEPRS